MVIRTPDKFVQRGTIETRFKQQIRRKKIAKQLKVIRAKKEAEKVLKGKPRFKISRGRIIDKLTGSSVSLKDVKDVKGTLTTAFQALEESRVPSKPEFRPTKRITTFEVTTRKRTRSFATKKRAEDFIKEEVKRRAKIKEIVSKAFTRGKTPLEIKLEDEFIAPSVKRALLQQVNKEKERKKELAKLPVKLLKNLETGQRIKTKVDRFAQRSFEFVRSGLDITLKSELKKVESKLSKKARTFISKVRGTISIKKAFSDVDKNLKTFNPKLHNKFSKVKSRLSTGKSPFRASNIVKNVLAGVITSPTFIAQLGVGITNAFWISEVKRNNKYFEKEVNNLLRKEAVRGAKIGVVQALLTPETYVAPLIPAFIRIANGRPVKTKMPFRTLKGLFRSKRGTVKKLSFKRKQQRGAKIEQRKVTRGIIEKGRPKQPKVKQLVEEIRKGSQLERFVVREIKTRGKTGEKILITKQDIFGIKSEVIIKQRPSRVAPVRQLDRLVFKRGKLVEVELGKFERVKGTPKKKGQPRLEGRIKSSKVIRPLPELPSGFSGGKVKVFTTQQIKSIIAKPPKKITARLPKVSSGKKQFIIELKTGEKITVLKIPKGLKLKKPKQPRGFRIGQREALLKKLKLQKEELSKARLETKRLINQKKSLQSKFSKAKKTRSKAKNKVTQLQKSKVSSKSLTKARSQLTQAIKSSFKLFEALKISTILLSANAVRIKSLQVQALQQAQALDLDQIQKLEQIQIEEIIKKPPVKKPPVKKPPVRKPPRKPPKKPPVRKPPVRKPPRKPPKKPPKKPPRKPPKLPPFIILKPKFENVTSSKSGFMVEVRERGKFKRVAKKILSEMDAKKLGQFLTDNSTSVTHKPVKVSGFINTKLKNLTLKNKKFRSAKRNKNLRVEKRRFRIDSLGEIKGLRVSKLARQSGFSLSKPRRKKKGLKSRNRVSIKKLQFIKL